MKSSCIKCGDCCRKFFVRTSLSASDNEDMVAFFKVTRNLDVETNNDDDIELHIPLPCNYLTEDNLCRIYNCRPAICVGYKCKRNCII